MFVRPLCFSFRRWNLFSSWKLTCTENDPSWNVRASNLKNDGLCMMVVRFYLFSVQFVFLTHSHTTDNKSTQSQKLNLCRWQDKMLVSLELVSPHFLAHSLAGNFSVDEMMITMNYGRTRNTFSKTFSWILIKLFKPFFMHAIMNSVLLLGTLLISTQFSRRCVRFFSTWKK